MGGVPRHAFKLGRRSALRIFVSGTESAQKVLSEGVSSLSTPLGVPESLIVTSLTPKLTLRGK